MNYYQVSSIMYSTLLNLIKDIDTLSIIDTPKEKDVVRIEESPYRITDTSIRLTNEIATAHILGEYPIQNRNNNVLIDDIGRIPIDDLIFNGGINV